MYDPMQPRLLVPGSLDWWLVRLGKRLDARRARMERYEDYYAGRQMLAFTSAEFSAAFGERFGTEFSANFTSLVVDAHRERLQVQGIRIGENREGDEDAWRWWQANRLDAESQTAHTESLVKGISYVLVWPDPVSGDPEATIESPLQVVVETVPGKSWKRIAALKRWLADDGKYRAELYLPDGIYKFRSAQSSNDFSVPTWSQVAQWTRDEGPEAWPVVNKIGVIPIVPIINRPRLMGTAFDAMGRLLRGVEVPDDGQSEIAMVMSNQDAINKLRADMLLASDFAGFRQRYIMGWDVPIDEKTGRPVDPLIASVRHTWIFPPPDPNDPNPSEIKVGEFEQTDLAGMIAGIAEEVQSLGAISRTPYHYLLPQSGQPPSGEALALDTPVHTPDGPVPMGEVVVGDRVFDGAGDVQIVEHVFAVMQDRPCFRVTFDDGASLVADAEHKWLTVNREERIAGRPGSIVTTEEMTRSLFAKNGQSGPPRPGVRGGVRYNHAIPVAAALDLPDLDLPIPPYALGVWLGDGTAVHADVTQHVDDAPALVASLAAVGVSATQNGAVGNTVRLVLGKVNTLGRCRRGHEHNANGRCSECSHIDYRARTYGEARPERTNIPFRSKLIAAGVLGNKHIPSAYFGASHRQRLALLQGLMDTDGSTAPGGSVTLDLNRERLALDAHRLIQSLGHKVAIHEGVEPGYGSRWRMAWTAPEPVFQMPRKLARQRFATGGASRFRYVRAVEPVPSVPVRCIAVSGPSHLFLVGDAYIPTHNSLKSAETGLVAKVRDSMIYKGESWEEVFRISYLFQGDARGKDLGAEIIWKDPESRTEAVHTDALVKQQSMGVPEEMLWEGLGYSPRQISRIKALIAAAPPPEPPPDVAPTTEPVMPAVISALAQGGN